MSKVNTLDAVAMVVDAYHEEVGADVELMPGETIFGKFYNAVVMISMGKDRNVDVKVIGGAPYTFDKAIDIFEEAANNGTK